MEKEDKNVNRITVTVIVSGEDLSVSVNTHQKVAELVRKALQESGNEGQPIDNWVLKTEDAREIDFELRISESGITDGMKLYLNPKAGEGGFN